MRFSMLYSGEQNLSFKSCLLFYAGDSLSLFCSKKYMYEALRWWSKINTITGIERLLPRNRQCISCFTITRSVWYKIKCRRKGNEVEFESRRNGSRRNGSRRNVSRRNKSRRNGNTPQIVSTDWNYVILFCSIVMFLLVCY